MPKQKKPSWSDRCWAWFFRDHGSEQLPTGDAENPWDVPQSSIDSIMDGMISAGSVLSRQLDGARVEIAALKESLKVVDYTLGAVCDARDQIAADRDEAVSERDQARDEVKALMAWRDGACGVKPAGVSQDVEEWVTRCQSNSDKATIGRDQARRIADMGKQRCMDARIERDETQGYQPMAFDAELSDLKPPWGDFASKMSLLRSISLDATM